MLVFLATALPAVAQDGLLVWLAGHRDEFGQLNGAGVGVIVSNKAAGQMVVKHDTVVAAPDGSEWDLSSPAVFQRFIIQGYNAWTAISPTGVPNKVTVASTPISGFFPVSMKIDSHADSLSGGSKVGTENIKGKITAIMAIVGGGPYGTQLALLPLDGFYGATGTIVTPAPKGGKHDEVTKITGTVLGLLNGRLALALSGTTASGQLVTYVMPEFVSVVNRRDDYRSPVLRDDNFGFARPH